jgi:hypothetical protein
MHDAAEYYSDAAADSKSGRCQRYYSQRRDSIALGGENGIIFIEKLIFYQGDEDLVLTLLSAGVNVLVTGNQGTASQVTPSKSASIKAILEKRESEVRCSKGPLKCEVEKRSNY